MILVDLEVPSLGRNYQFSLDEDTSVNLLIIEIAEMICQKERCSLDGSAEELSLYSRRKKCVLNRRTTLSRQTVSGADHLILI